MELTLRIYDGWRKDKIKVAVALAICKHEQGESEVADTAHKQLVCSLKERQGFKHVLVIVLHCREPPKFKTSYDPSACSGVATDKTFLVYYLKGKVLAEFAGNRVNVGFFLDTVMLATVV